MNKLKTTILFFLIFIQFSIAQNKDSLNIINLKNEVSRLENQVKTVEKNQLNYKIEKDLIKETYSSNYERINMIITIILGIIGVIGYIGIRDISSIKKEYVNELEKLKGLQIDFESKSKEFNTEKDKFDSEIRKILIENEEQNRKIKFIELKEKITSFLRDNKLYESLDFIGAALEISPEDESILRYKARTLCRLNRLEDSLSIYEKLHKNSPEDKGLVLDLIEMMMFNKEFEKAEKLIDQNSAIYNARNEGKLAKLMSLFKHYHLNEEVELLDGVKDLVDFSDLNSISKIINEWDLEEAKFVSAHLPVSEQKKQLQNVLWYLDGQINGKTLCNRLNIEIKNT